MKRVPSLPLAFVPVVGTLCLAAIHPMALAGQPATVPSTMPSSLLVDIPAPPPGIVAITGPTTSPTTAPVAFHPHLHITLDCTEAPDLADEGKRIAKAMIDEYPRLCRELEVPGRKPPEKLLVKFGHIAATGVTIWSAKDPYIILNIDSYRKDPDNLGCAVHELAHVVQDYVLRHPPLWLTEGIADYARWFVYEPASKRPHPDPDTATYHDGYQNTAAFLDWCQRTYDPDLIKKLNVICTEGHYGNRTTWMQLTGHTLPELDAKWMESIQVPEK